MKDPKGVRLYFQRQARDMLRATREEKGLTYTELARRLEAYGVLIETQSLTNKINRGTYSFAFALQALAAMNVKSLPVPQLPSTKPTRPKAVATLDPSEEE